uniref:Reverse transcriptase domain-containing protein n=1 Tax=Fagus sylvatica TaxID=28930 RepID=A0A2N9GX70_FAGSY
MRSRKGIPMPTPLHHHQHHRDRRCHQSQKGKDSQMDSKIDSLEEKIRLMQGLNSFGEHRLLQHVLVPQHDGATQVQGPGIRKVKEDLPLEGAGGYLPGSIWFQLPNSSWIGSIFQRNGEEEQVKTFQGSMPQEIVDMTALLALAEQAAKKDSGEEEGRGCANDREEQRKTKDKLSQSSPCNRVQPRPTPIRAPTQAPASGPSTPNADEASVGNQANDNRPYNGPQRRDFNQNLTCDFHFGEGGTCDGKLPTSLKHRVQDLIDHGILKFEGSAQHYHQPPAQPSRREEQRTHHPARSTTRDHQQGDICEYHSGARGHSLECCEEFKKEIAKPDGKGVGKEERKYHQEKVASRYDPSDLDWYAELDLRQHRLICRSTARRWPYTVENELLMISVGTIWRRAFLKQYRFNTESITQIFGVEEKTRSCTSSPTIGVNDVIVEIEEKSEMSSLPALIEEEEEKQAKTPPTNITVAANEKEELIELPPPKALPTNITVATNEEEELTELSPPKDPNNDTTAEEVRTGPMVEGLSIHTITEEEDSTAPPTRHCQQGEEAKMWTCVPLLQHISSSNDQNASPVKQALRRMKPEIILKIKEEVEKQLKAGFLSTVTYSDWVANIVPVPKKDGKVRINKCRVLIHGQDSQGTIRSKMAEEDKSKTAFVTHWGTFMYDVMPFGLKNAGATYQRAMVTLFHDMIHHEIEVYVDDMIAKSRTAQDHLTDLRKLFQRSEEVSAQTESEQHARTKDRERDPKLLGKDQLHSSLHCTAHCNLRASVQVAEERWRPLILYLTVQEASMGCMLGQARRDWEEGASNLLSSARSSRSRRPATCWLRRRAVHWLGPPKKLRQYMLYYTTCSKGDQGNKPIADYLADYPSEQLELMDSEFPDEDVMTVDEGGHYAEEANRLIPRDACRIDGSPCLMDPSWPGRFMRAGYYWLTMESDCIRHVQTCHKCQMYQNCKNAPPQYVHTMASPWPFSAWGMDVIEDAHHRQCFQPKQPHDGPAMPAVQDPAPQLCSIPPEDERSRGSCLTKNVKKILSKMTETYKDWHEHLPYALCAYRTSVRTSVRSHPLLLGIRDGSSTASRSGDPFFENPVTRLSWNEARTLPEVNRKSLQQEGSTSHLSKPGRPRLEEEEHGPIRSREESSHHHMRVRTW